MSRRASIFDGLARAWAAAVGRRPAVYAFGKHPAFADYLDVARLPPVPAAFRHFHDRLRPAVERDGGPAEPTLIAWRERGTSAVLWAHPSRDRGDAAGHVRRCPLLLAVSAPADLTTLLAFAGGRLADLAERVVALNGDAALAAIAGAAAEWPTSPLMAAEPHPIAERAMDAVRSTAGPVWVVADAARAAVEPGPFSILTAATLHDRITGTDRSSA